MLPNGAPQQQWDDLKQSFCDALEWADLIAAERMRFRAIGERVRIPRGPEISYPEIVDINPWVESHVSHTHALIVWRADQTAKIEKQYLEGKAKLAQYAGVPVDKIAAVVPHYRLDRWRRDEVGEISNVATQVQLAIPEVGDQFPFTELHSREDARVRPAHALADGLIAPRKHGIWSVIRPRNGFSCRCFTIQLSKRQSIRMGLMSPTGKFLLDDVRWPNDAAKRAYEIGVPYHGQSYQSVPRAIAKSMFPDAGFTSKFVASDLENIGAAA